MNWYRHCLSICLGTKLLLKHLPAIHLLILGRLDMYGVPGSREKEADRALRPCTRIREADWPSLVVEVGVSESPSQLRTDAHFWLTQSEGETHVVILIAVNKTSRLVKTERWEYMPRTRSGATHSLQKMLALSLQPNGQLTGGTLYIPASKVFDVLRAGVLPNDFQFDAQDLAGYIYTGVLVPTQLVLRDGCVTRFAAEGARYNHVYD